MAMTASDLYRRDVLVERLKKVWGKLSKDEQSALETVVNSMVLNHPDEVVYRPLSEALLVERIDRSLEHVSQGQQQPSEEMEAELIAEFNL